MFERLLNAKICKLQALLYRAHGDNPNDAELIRTLTAQAKSERCADCFDRYIQHYERK